MRSPAKTEDDRRQFSRHAGKGLIARVGNQLVEVLDISMGGMKLEKTFDAAAGPLGFVLIPRHENKLDLNKGVKASGTVVRVEDDGVAIQFAATYALSKLVVWITSEKLGVAPHMVK